jgi:hypothetical protein
MRRLINSAITVALVCASFQSNSVLADLPLCTRGIDGSYLVCEGSASAGTGGSSSIVRNVGATLSGSGTTTRYLPYNRLVTGANGEPCIMTGYYEEGTSPNDAAITDPVTQNVQDIHNLPPLEYPPCPVQPRAPGEPAPVETPAMIAMRYWEQVPLPKPAPHIAPGRAITGKVAYLETHGEVARTYTNPTTIYGQLVIVASGSYEVDWGDGTKTGPHAFEGRAWPDGGITHVYTDVGSYDILVTEKWTATWSLGGERGLLRTLATSGRIDDFPVEQVQAVISR